MASSKHFFGDSPETERASRAIAAGTIGALGCLVLLVLLVGLFVTHHSYIGEQTLKENGVNSTGALLRIEGISGRNPSYRIHFRYKIIDDDKSGASSLGSEVVDRPNLDDIRSSTIIHVVYARFDPSIVRIDTALNPALGRGETDPTWVWIVLIVFASLITTGGIIWTFKVPNWTVY